MCSTNQGLYIFLSLKLCRSIRVTDEISGEELTMWENERFEVFTPLSKPPHLPRNDHDKLTWVIKIPQK